MFRQPKITRLLLATDLSQNANKALRYAMSLANAYQAQYTILHVIEKMPPNAELLTTAFLGYDDVQELRAKSQPDLIEKIKSRIQQLCEEAAEPEPACSFVAPHIIVEPGRAADRILHHTSTGLYDALVIGSRGHGAIQEALLGGTANKILHSCRIPVLVIPLSEQ